MFFCLSVTMTTHVQAKLYVHAHPTFSLVSGVATLQEECLHGPRDAVSSARNLDGAKEEGWLSSYWQIRRC